MIVAKVSFSKLGEYLMYTFHMIFPTDAMYYHIIYECLIAFNPSYSMINHPLESSN